MRYLPTGEWMQKADSYQGKMYHYLHGAALRSLDGSDNL